MADEATVYSSLQINKGNLQYRSATQAYRQDVTGTLGPTPGAFQATTNGVDVDLSDLTTPGLCEIINLDSTNSVLIGRWDQTNSVFYPLMEVGPGKNVIFMLAADVEDEYSGAGTGTSATVSTLRVKALNAACNVAVLAFER